MATEIELVGRDRHGRVLIKDTRPDGTVAVLACDPLDPDQSGGIVVHPDEELSTGAPPSPATRGDFPWGRVQAMLGISPQDPFVLTVDTSLLPPGIAVFLTDTFLGKALEMAEQGKREVTISPEDAEGWGYRSIQRGMHA